MGKGQRRNLPQGFLSRLSLKTKDFLVRFRGAFGSINNRLAYLVTHFGECARRVFDATAFWQYWVAP